MKKNENGRPITVEDHKELARRHAERKVSAVNDALQFPNGEAFEEELNAILNSDAEANGEIVAIALLDCDKFDHINKDFGTDEGDRVLIEAGKYIRDSLPEGAKVYRIGGDEFAILFRGTLEREEIFLLLNDLKNNYAVQTPDGVRQTITVGWWKQGVHGQGGENGSEDQPLYPGPAAAAGEAGQTGRRGRGDPSEGRAGPAAEKI